MNDSFFSRERAAGYDPDVLRDAIVLVVGVGALGQNVAMNLALSQLGTILLVDMDKWELHNATRSIFFPDREERRHWGEYKSRGVACKIGKMISWSQAPRLFWSTKPIQAVGDTPFRLANVVVGAVDRKSGRDYLGYKTAQFHVPLIEGGFNGPRMNATILPNDSDDAPCWHCNLYDAGDRYMEVQLGCTKVAKLAEEAGYTPAIQSAAAYLGAFMSETTIQLLHGNAQLANRQTFMNIRSATTTVNRLGFSPNCQHHSHPSQSDFTLSVSSDATCANVLASLERHLSTPVVRLPFRYLVRVGCAHCKQPIKVDQPEWVMSNLLFCQDCGGSWKQTDEAGNEIYRTLSADIEPLLSLPATQVGLVQGSILEVSNDQQHLTFELQSDSCLSFFTQVQENYHAL